MKKLQSRLQSSIRYELNRRLTELKDRGYWSSFTRNCFYLPLYDNDVSNYVAVIASLAAKHVTHQGAFSRIYLGAREKVESISVGFALKEALYFMLSSGVREVVETKMDAAEMYSACGTISLTAASMTDRGVAATVFASLDLVYSGRVRWINKEFMGHRSVILNNIKADMSNVTEIIKRISSKGAGILRTVGLKGMPIKDIIMASAMTEVKPCSPPCWVGISDESGNGYNANYPLCTLSAAIEQDIIREVNGAYSARHLSMNLSISGGAIHMACTTSKRTSIVTQSEAARFPNEHIVVV